VPRRRSICEDGACEVLGVAVGWKLCFQAVGLPAVMVVLCVRSNGLFLISGTREPFCHKILLGDSTPSLGF
jgi:hypothetical protein